VSIHNLRVTCCRILSHIEIEPSLGFNLISGANGSGKSSLLEAISLLGTGRSFRTATVAPVVQEGNRVVTVSAQIETAIGTTLSVGMERGKGSQRLQINHTAVQRLSEFAEQLPLQIITPESIDLVMGPPKGRRSFIDWGMFHVEPLFLPLTQRYKKIIRHRNALLKKRVGIGTQLPYWDEQLVEVGESLTEQRKQYIIELIDRYQSIVLEKIPTLTKLDISFEYKQGWKSTLSLSQALEQSRDRERAVGYTVVGPQEADLLIRTADDKAKQVLSRGQAKLLSMGLYLSQLSHLDDKRGKRGVVLIDDLFSELDPKNSLTILDHLVDSGHQIFATTADDVTELLNRYPVKVFHVEHGEISER
jgi:DNA replication and repair protein RecF